MKIVPRNSAQFVPPAVAALLSQLSDLPGASDVSAASYAASVILPRTRWPVQEFLPRLVDNLSSLQNRLILDRELQQQAKGSFSPYTLSLLDLEGKRVEFLVLPRPATLPGGRRVTAAALATPETPQENPPDARAERAQLLNLLEVLPAYVLLIDSSHIIHFENRVSRELFGTGRGKPCYEVLQGRSSPCSSCPPFTVLTNNAICASEWFCQRTNNAFRVHSYSFKDQHNHKMVLKVGINITAGVRAQHALNLSEQRYRSITDNLTVGVALLDRLLVAATVNPRLSEWFGPEAVKGAPICDILQRQCAGAEGSCSGCMFRQTLEDKKNHERDFSLLTFTGEQRRFRLVSCPILARSGEAKGITMMLEDITERHNVNQRLQQLHRLEAMGTLAGGVAHEINQPLSALHLYASGLHLLLEQQADIPVPRIMERLSLILGQTEKIREIISHMRALVFHEEKPSLEPVSVASGVEGALALVGSQLLAHGVRVTSAIPAGTPQVRANRTQFEQVLINLLINAMHALDTVDREAKEIRISADETPTGQVRIRVMDNGPGVQGMEDQIFTPFFSTKDPHQGMGLGLSIVHAFVSAWGGEIRAENNGAVPGATFTLTLYAEKPEADGREELAAVMEG